MNTATSHHDHHHHHNQQKQQQQQQDTHTYNSTVGSEICDYYKNKCVFITGATGFIGKVLIEKLLRSCPDIKTVYLLVRSRRGHTPKQRVNDLLHCKLFESLSQFNPEFRDKLVAIEGDLVEPNLGISAEDEKTLIDNVNIVFHSAATVRFDEPLKLAIEMNIIGVKKMIALAKKLKHLEVFVHVSTAYANCDRQHVSEVVYNPPVQPEKLLEAVDWMEEDLVKLLTPKIIQFRPNTYTYTKAIAECLITEAEKEIPFTIVRPSIVGASWREPMPGWIDNYNGPTAIFVAFGKGFLRVMCGNRSATADIVPVDVTVNLMIAAAWFKGAKKTKDTIVYNCSTGQINALKWSTVEHVTCSYLVKDPLENVFLPPAAHFTSSKIIKNIIVFVEQMIPSYILDFYMKLTHKKPMFVRIQSKLKKAVETLEFFTSHQWEFTNDNLFMLMNQMNDVDNKIFNFDVRSLNWKQYLERYCLGAKQFVLKEDITQLNKCRKELAKKKRIQSIIKWIFLFTIVKFFILRKYSLKTLLLFIFDFAQKLGNQIVSRFVKL